jgi:hypothetical protein
MSAAVKLYNHPDYEKERILYEKWRDFYEGDHATLTGNPRYLIPHYVETLGTPQSDKLLALRRARTRFLEVPEIIVSIWISFFFRQEPTLGADTLKLLNGIEGNIDGQGTSITRFLEQVLVDGLIYGDKIGIVDTFANALDRPYWIRVSPMDLRDWDIEYLDPERIGKANAARREYFQVEKRSRLDVEPEVIHYSDMLYMADGKYAVDRFRIPTTKERKEMRIVSEEQSWIKVETIESDLDEIPIVIQKGESWIKGVVEETQRHFNIRSAKDSVEHEQAYKKLFLIGNNLDDPEQLKAISEHVWPILPEGSTIHEVGEVNVSGYQASMSEALENAFKVGLNQLRQVAGDSAQVQSKEANQAEKDERLALVESTIAELEDFAKKMLGYSFKFMGDDKTEPEISFSKELTDEDSDQFANLYSIFADKIRRFPELEQMVLKKVVGKMFTGDQLDDAIKIVDGKSPNGTIQSEADREADDIADQIVGEVLDADQTRT